MRKRTLINKTNIIVLVIFLSICFLTVGYSAFSATGRIENAMATVKPKASARITGLVLSGTSNGGVSDSEGYNVSKILANINLPAADSTVTYKVNATVFNSAEMKISSITGLPSNLEYTLSGYNLGDTLCNSNNECNLGATDEFYITIGYASGGYNSSSTEYSINLDVNFAQVLHVAKVGNTYFETLQAAVNSVPNNTQTTVYLLMDTQERVTINAGKNIVFNFYNNTLRNNGNAPIMENAGTISISNGNFVSNGAQQAIFNNTGTFYLSGGTASVSGGSSKQAVYNSGTMVISGDVSLSNTASNRAVVQNLAGGNLTITGGTFVASNFSAVENAGTLVIGAQGGTPSTSSPSFRGKDYGILSTVNYAFYDGVLGGQDAPVNDETKINPYESGYDFIKRDQSLGGNTYHTLYLGHKIIITFDPNQGSCSEQTREMEAGGKIGPLPTPTRTDYEFDGWFTDASGGTEITENTVFNSSDTIYAHWTHITQVKVARIGQTEYTSLEDAWTDAMASNSTSTIVILRDISLSNKLVVSSSKSVIIDLNGKTVSNTSGTVFEISNGGTFELKDTASGGVLSGGIVDSNNKQNTVINNKAGGVVTISSGTVSSGQSQVIDNSGTMTITGGTVKFTASVNQGLINNNAGGIMSITGGTIINTYNIQKGQAVYNKGTLSISGNPVLSSNSYQRATVQNDASGASITISGGTIRSTNSTCERGAIQNVSGATVTMTGGSVTSASTNSNSGAIQNAGTVILGTKDGSISTTSPVLQSDIYGVNNSGTLKFYDGIVKGKTACFNGTINEVETNANIVYSTETIGGVVYNTAILSL